MRIKPVASQILRSAGMFEFADRCRGGIDSLKSYRSRQRFKQENPGFALPPADLAYDAYGNVNPEIYRQRGLEHARTIAGLIRKHHPGARVIAEWGCGPMRVLRHMPALFPDSEIIGLDYNPQTIEWCKREFTTIRFLLNQLSPPLPLKDGGADVIYNISVFTHLSEPLHYAYVSDLVRCLAPGGILISTFQGDRYKDKLTATERATYDQGRIVVRDGVTEGKRGFSAFHNPAFIRGLFKDLDILEHTNDSTDWFDQDFWVVKRPN
jgi:SAM-dependent methyltransferase